MSGRAATLNVIPGDFALSVGRSEMPAPRGWRWVALTDVARLESGHTPSREHSDYWDGNIPWIGIRDARIHHGKTVTDTLQTVTKKGIDNSAARVLPAGTVCLSRTASVGYVVIMGREMATSQDFVNWVCGPDLDPKFLQQLLIAENKSLFRFGKGSTHTTIYYPEVKAFHICLPPLDEQRRIVAKLESLQTRSRRAREALDAVPPSSKNSANPSSPPPSAATSPKTGAPRTPMSNQPQSSSSASAPSGVRSGQRRSLPSSRPRVGLPVTIGGRRRYPFGQPRPNAAGVIGVGRLSDVWVSERRPGGRGGADSPRGAA